MNLTEFLGFHSTFAFTIAILKSLLLFTAIIVNLYFTKSCFPIALRKISFSLLVKTHIVEKLPLNSAKSWSK